MKTNDLTDKDLTDRLVVSRRSWIELYRKLNKTKLSALEDRKYYNWLLLEYEKESFKIRRELERRLGNEELTGIRKWLCK